MVLGQVLSPVLAQHYTRQLELYRSRQLPRLASLPFVELLSHHQDPAYTQGLEQNLMQYIGRSLEGGAPKRKATFAARLPADLPIHPDVEPYSVRYPTSSGAPTEQHCLRARAPIAACTIIGPYRGRMCVGAEYNALVDDPGEWGFEGEALEWRLKLDAYATNLECFVGLEGLDEALLHDSHGAFPCSAFMYGNATALVNDPRCDPLANPSEPVAHLANTRVLEFRVGAWVFPFLATIQGVAQGEPLLYDYGMPYWEGFAERQQLLDTRRALLSTENKHTALQDKYAEMAAALAAAEAKAQALQSALQWQDSGGIPGLHQDQLLHSRTIE
ncbi:hypothetical protein WJX72_004872 [[Myrmecia] bisecta]|uniref:SET domain-containing protein n=1 Tax=[Myrmecia] bisecta TaxID=41462 RepID=A0AAW1P2S0_9CHLO